MMQTLWQDIRYSARLLMKSPAVTAVAILSLALGIGANTAVFSIVNAALLRSLPVREPDRLMFVFNGTADNPYSNFSYPAYTDYRDQNEVFDGLTGFSPISVSARIDDQTDLLSGSIVSGNYFDVLGVRASTGRTFSIDEDKTPGAHPVVVISRALWQKRFAASAEVIGQQIALNGHSFTIIGVAPAGFNGPEIFETNDIYVPMMMQALVRPPRAGFSGDMNPDLLARRSNSWINVIGRLKPDISQEQAQANLSAIASHLAQAYPDTTRDRIATLFPVSKIDPRAYTQLVATAALLMAVVAMVLLIACANVANLMLARATARRKEIAVRLAMGATRARLVRQLMTASVMLALAGGGVGLLLALWTTEALKTVRPPTGIFSFALDYSLDLRVLAFTLALSAATGILFGLAPALQASRPDLIAAIKDETFAPFQKSHRFRLRDALVIAQVALSLVLLVGAGLFLRSLSYAQSIDPGFDAEKILTARLDINLLRYTKAQGREFYRQATERVSALPGVEAVSLARVVPISGGGRNTNVLVEGQSNDPVASENPQTSGANVVALNYFQTMGIAFARGRDFTTQDREGAPGVAIINEAFARRYFIDAEPLGKRISLNNANGPWVEIVGIVRDSKYRTLNETPRPMLYQPLDQNHETGMTMHVRAAGRPANLAAAVRSELQSLDRNLPVTQVEPLTALLESSLFPARMGAVMLAVLGGLALALASVGLYGVMSYAVSRRRREIGIRLALGAQTSNVMRMVLREGMTLVGIGMLIGWIAAVALARLLASFLFGISTMDAATFALIPIMLAVVAMVANYLPARRAMKVDPMVALRYE
ncbi:MAG TPA: ABC transporter permease [Blastocatellia bacterium]|jgi:predicted permease